jgi:LAGLIDADG endonuclease
MHLASYISGYIDGEGCFCVSFVPSKRHRFGWEVRPSFSVSQNRDRAEFLEKLKELWGCGSIRPDRSDQTVKYEVRSIGDLIRVVLPHFREYPLLSSKQQDVELFDEVCRIVHAKRHLTPEGLTQIVKLAMGMNPSGKRKYSEDEILGSLQSGEGIVCATGNRGST